MRVVFLGTPEFALPTLRRLNECHEVVAVFCQPDKPQGRGSRVDSPIVKKLAQDMGLQVFQPERINKALDLLAGLNPDIMVTAAYGQILSSKVLKVARHGVINVHASLLPKYRGAAPVQWAIINGESVTGVTIMQTARGVDNGDIILQKQLHILPHENAEQVLQRLSVLGAEALIEALDSIENGTACFVPQDEEQASHFPMLQKTDGEINWSDSAHKIACKVRGTNPWPCAYTYFDQLPIKIWQAEAVEGGDNQNVGEVVVCDKNQLIVACGNGCLKILQLQLPNAKRLNVQDFLRGNRQIVCGSIFSGQL